MAAAACASLGTCLVESVSLSAAQTLSAVQMLSAALPQNVSIPLLREIVWAVLIYPCEQFYKRGLWRNRHFHDICAQLTKHDAEFWSRHPDACAEIIARDMDSWIAYFHFGLYFLLLLAIGWRALKVVCGK